ncbi:MAG: thioredoxin [Oscillospiraceae bacterium]|nr:thioredoxin [Oscillospiraceae bacterium]MDY6208831.1 thioredoxin [Oscillospiraceae bacterium]
MMNIQNISEFNEKVLNSDIPVLVDFYADWCGPCKMMAPLVEELSREASGFSVYKVNVDNVPEAAEKFGVSSIPTFVVIKNGTEIARNIGAAPKQRLLELISKAT